MAKEISPEDLPKDTRRKYPWDLWTNGSWWEATKGVDYTCDTEGFRNGIYSYARRNGVKVETKVSGEAVAFKFTRPMSNAEAATLVIGLGAAALHHTAHKGDEEESK